MRRIVLWFASTAVVLMLLAGYHTSFSGALTPGTSTSVYSAGVLAAPQTSKSSTSSTSSTTSNSSAGGNASGGASVSGGASTTSTITGDTVQTRWGPVQVEVSVAGSKITGVSVLQYPDTNPTDAQINGYALPILVDETMTAQSANIDMVSGATYTSTGYQQSLQSALDQAGR
ncbi:FMN-binding protein [Nocardioides sp.]|uniref:FMN-binding protein n=1 Tax=Nocardioides sp. TaxID=35761 RepID=UPI00286E9E66|nr:FMN-binding protein [Nocardioides sp.]